jgi:dihydroxy-acid dehydratase
VGELDDDAWETLEGSVNVGVGTCNVMGTATKMAAVAEVPGFPLPGSTLPATASSRVSPPEGLETSLSSFLVRTSS